MKTPDTLRAAARTCLLGAALAVALAPGSARAEPTFLSKQYTRCGACHVSASGGGLLSRYGRLLSHRELSLTGRRTATAEPGADPATQDDSGGEESFLYGLLGDALGPLQLGVALRPSHVRTTVAGLTFDRNLLMTADLLAAVQAHGWTFYGQIGREPTATGGRLDSYEHWIGYESSRGLGLRAGRFLPAYGVKFADHTAFNRSALGLRQYDQVYGLEFSRSTPRTFAQVTVSPGLAESLLSDRQSGTFNATARFQVDTGPSTALVMSGLYREGSVSQPGQRAAGVAVGVAPARRLTIWTQGDILSTEGADQTTFVFTNETAVEAIRGLWLKVSPQLRTEGDVQPQVMRWAFSATFLPRTHWNVNLTFYRDKPSESTPVKTWLAQLHLYL